MSNPDLEEFVKKARDKKLSNDEIRQKLEKAEWPLADINDALGAAGDDELEVPKPPSTVQATAAPIAVVHNLSVRGFEYSIMFISLWASAFSIASLMITYINDLADKTTGSYVYGTSNTFSILAITILIVSFPIFAYMFLRLKRIELAEPELRHDSSRRRFTQLTMLLSFLVGLGFVIYFLYTALSSGNNNPPTYYPNGGGPLDTSSDSLLFPFLRTLVVVAISGVIFLYYWREDHKRG